MLYVILIKTSHLADSAFVKFHPDVIQLFDAAIDKNIWLEILEPLNCSIIRGQWPRAVEQLVFSVTCPKNSGLSLHTHHITVLFP